MMRTVTMIPIGDEPPTFTSVWPEVDDRKHQAAVSRVIENGVWSYSRGDQQIQALVEVGAIPYRERYQPRWYSGS